MEPEIKTLEIYRNADDGTFEMLIDGQQINGVEEYELKSCPISGEPKLKLTLNVCDFKVDFK